MMDSKALADRQKTISADIRSALGGGDFDNVVTQRTAAVGHDRIATLQARIGALEEEKKRHSTAIDQEIADSKREMAQVKTELEAASKPPATGTLSRVAARAAPRQPARSARRKTPK